MDSNHIYHNPVLFPRYFILMTLFQIGNQIFDNNSSDSHIYSPNLAVNQKVNFKAEIRGCARHLPKAICQHLMIYIIYIIQYMPKAIYVNTLSYIPIVYVKMRNIWEKIMGTNFSYWECEEESFVQKHSIRFCCVHTILTL